MVHLLLRERMHKSAGKFFPAKIEVGWVGDFSCITVFQVRILVCGANTSDPRAILGDFVATAKDVSRLPALSTLIWLARVPVGRVSVCRFFV